MCVGVLPACMSAAKVCLVPIWPSDPLEEELWLVVSCHVGARKRAWSLWKNSKCSLNCS